MYQRYRTNQSILEERRRTKYLANKASGLYRCVICNYNGASTSAINKHNRSQLHRLVVLDTTPSKI